MDGNIVQITPEPAPMPRDHVPTEAEVAAAAEEKPLKPGWQSSEFWVATSSQVVAALVAFGVLTQSDTSVINAWVGKMAAALGAVICLSVTAWRYVDRRTELKKGKMKKDEGFPLMAFLLALGAVFLFFPGQVAAGSVAGAVQNTQHVQQPMRYLTYDEGWRLANRERRNLVVCRMMGHHQMYAAYLDALRNGWIFAVAADGDVRVRPGVTDFVFIRKTTLQIGFVSLRCCPRRERDPLPPVPQTDPAMMMMLNQIAGQNTQILALLMAQQNRPVPAPANPPVVLLPINTPPPTIINNPAPIGTMPIQGQPPQQLLPISGAPQQLLPIQGAPQQLLPIVGQPQQALPIAGAPQQIINIHGAPQQQLPIGLQQQVVPVQPGPGQLLPTQPAPVVPSPITVPVPVNPVPVPPQQQLPIAGPQPVRVDDPGPPAPYPQSYTANFFRR